MRLEARAHKILREMNEEGKVVTVSKEGTYRIDHAFAMGLMPIKEDFKKLNINSYQYALDSESGRLNLHNKQSLYQRIINYFVKS